MSERRGGSLFFPIAVLVVIWVFFTGKSRGTCQLVASPRCPSVLYAQCLKAVEEAANRAQAHRGRPSYAIFSINDVPGAAQLDKSMALLCELQEKAEGDLMVLHVDGDSMHDFFYDNMPTIRPYLGSRYIVSFSEDSQNSTLMGVETDEEMAAAIQHLLGDA